MTRKDPRLLGLADLEAALDAFGADRTRWPAPLRHALSGLVASDARAAKLLKDGEVFDRLIDGAPAYDSQKLNGLADRIFAQVDANPRVIPLRRPAKSLFGSRDFGFAAGALAASLLLGIFVGQSNIVTPATDLIINSDASGTTGANTQTALTYDSESLLDEDLL